MSVASLVTGGIGPASNTVALLVTKGFGIGAAVLFDVVELQYILPDGELDYVLPEGELDYVLPDAWSVSITAPQSYCVGLGETCNFAVSLAGRVGSSETLTGTPTVTETTSLSATIANVQVNTVALTIRGETVAIGQAVQGTVSGWSGAGTCTLRVTCGTDATPAQTRGGLVDITVVDDGS